MSSRRSRIRAFAGASCSIGSALLVVGGCAQPPQPGPEPLQLGPASYASAAEKPRIRWGDAPTSLNDRCMVRRTKLNLRMPPIFVNGQPVGFC